MRLPYPLGTPAMRRQALPDGAAGYLLPDPYGGSLSSSQKAVGGSIPLEVDTYQAQPEKSPHGQNNGLSGENNGEIAKIYIIALEYEK